MKVRIDEDGTLFDAQLEWEHEEGKRENERERERKTIRQKQIYLMIIFQPDMYVFIPLGVFFFLRDRFEC